jgi:hypothetical protein
MTVSSDGLRYGCQERHLLWTNLDGTNIHLLPILWATGLLITTRVFTRAGQVILGLVALEASTHLRAHRHSVLIHDGPKMIGMWEIQGTWLVV